MRNRVERPPWCGQCDPDSRLVEAYGGAAARCPRCHAATQPGGRHAPKLQGSSRLDLIVGDDK